MSNWKLIDTSGSVRDLQTYYGFRVQFSPGAGMAPVENISTDFGILDGGLFDRTRIPVRSFELVGTISSSTASALHTTRKNLINAVKPDRSASQGPVVLQYHGASDVVQASAYYDGGMEMGATFSGPNELDMALRFVQFDPYWEATTSTSQSLSTQTTISNANYIIQQDLTTGCWTSLSSGMNSDATGMATDASGNLYVTGAFTTAGGTAASRIAKWNGSTFTSLSSGLNNTGEVITIAPDGTVYVGGTFTTAGGTSVCRIAKWNGTTWSSTAARGPDNDVRALVTGNDGAIYLGGVFTSIAGATYNRIAKWDGSSFTSLSSGMNGGVVELANGLDGSIYAGGGFGTAGGTTACAIARWTGSTWLPVGTGSANNQAFALTVGPDGSVYLGGVFTNIGGTDASRVARWNGTGWSPMSTGMSGCVFSLATACGIVYAGGAFTAVGGITLPDSLATWNGTNWTPIGIDLPGAAEINQIHVANNKLNITFTTAGTASAAVVTSVTNTGNATTYPVLTACAPTSTSARLYQLINYTSGEGIYFNLTLAAGEVATLDLRPGKKSFTSNFRGNIISSVLPISNVSTFKLLPGSNNISFFMTSGSGSARLTWTPRYWGIDS